MISQKEYEEYKFAVEEIPFLADEVDNVEELYSNWDGSPELEHLIECFERWKNGER